MAEHPRLVWAVAAVAGIVAILLVGFAVLGAGTPNLPFGDGDGDGNGDGDSEARADDLPDADITFHPNPDSMTVGYEGGDTLPSHEVYVHVEDGRNRTWAAWDADLQAPQPLDAGETMTIPEWSEGQWVRVYYQGNNSSGVLASHEP